MTDNLIGEQVRACLARADRIQDRTGELTDVDATDVLTGVGSWSMLPSWGERGWDLGAWPLWVLRIRDNVDGTADLAEYIEGDVRAWRFPDAALRDEAVSWMAFDQWTREGRPWVSGLDRPSPAMLVPFAWNPVPA